jgi:hypothetical protein
VDIAGAKALKTRLGVDEKTERGSTGVDVDVPDGVPPVYRWLGIAPPDRNARLEDAEGDEPAAQIGSRA